MGQNIQVKRGRRRGLLQISRSSCRRVDGIHCWLRDRQWHRSMCKQISRSHMLCRSAEHINARIGARRQQSSSGVSIAVALLKKDRSSIRVREYMKMQQTCTTIGSCSLLTLRGSIWAMISTRQRRLK